MIRRLLTLFFVIVPSVFGVETLVVDSVSRNIINQGAVNFATSQLKVNGIAVVGGGGGTGTGGGTIDNVRLNLPTALFSPSVVDYVVSAGLAEGTTSLVAQPNGTVFANLSGGSNAPVFATVSDLKTAQGLNNVDNTSDLGKPISTATATALATLTTNVTTNTSAITALTTTVGGKADTTTVNTALALKADKTYVDSQDATKQNSWGLPPTNGYIAAGNTTGTLFWVNPTTLGTTSATYTDGITNSTSLLTSNQAGFVSTDVGKVVTGSGIPSVPATTIVSIGSGGLSVTLSATTTTVNPLTFVIQNRFAGGGGGTVTLFSSGDLSLSSPVGAKFFTTTVTSGSSTPAQAFTLTNAPASSFFGNSVNASNPPAYMDAATALTTLGATTLGQNLFTLPNTTAIAFLRINADNTVTKLDAANFRNAIGAGTLTSVAVTNNLGSNPPFAVSVSTTTPATPTAPAIIFDPANQLTNTFYGNPAAGSAPPTFMSASTARGALGGTTAGQNLFMIGNPNAPGYPHFNSSGSANTTNVLTPAGVLSDIGAASTTDPRFQATVIGIRKGNGASGGPPVPNADTAAVANVDYGKPVEAVVANVSVATWPTVGGVPATIVRQHPALGPPLPNKSINLPAANVFAPGTILTFIDAETTTNFGRTFAPIGGDTFADGTTTPILPFIAGKLGTNGSKTALFETNGVSTWTWLGAGAVDHLEDPGDATKRAVFDLTAIPSPAPPPVVVHIPAQDSATAITTNNATLDPDSWLQDFNAVTGTFSSKWIYWGNIHSSAFNIDCTGTQCAGNTVTVPTTTTYDTINLIKPAALSAPLTIILNGAATYGPDERVNFRDATGCITQTNFVTLQALSGETINGANVVTIKDTYALRQLQPNGTTPGNWQITAGPGAGGVSIAWAGNAALPESGGNITWNATTNLTTQTAWCTLTADDTLIINNAQAGMIFNLVVKQSATPHTLKIQYPGLAGNTGAGVIIKTTDPAYAANAVSYVQGIWTGVDNTINSLWTTVGIAPFTIGAIPCNTIADIQGAWTITPTVPGAVVVGSATARQYFGGKFVVTSTNNVVCAIEAAIGRIGTSGTFTSPGVNTSFYLVTDDGATPGKPSRLDVPANVIAGPISGPRSDSLPVVSTGDGSAAVTPAIKVLLPTTATLTVNSTYWVVVKTETTGQNANCLGWVNRPTGAGPGIPLTTYAPAFSTDGITWTSASNANLYVHTYK